MSPSFPGSQNATPGVFDTVSTLSRGLSTPGQGRITCIIGTGSRSEVLISAANGSGNDGLDPTYTTITGADGRHFLLTYSPIISNRTQLYKNGVLLQGLEQLISSNTFPNAYDYRIDIATGEIELQQARLVDQGGSFYSASVTNVGTGSLQNLALVDVNAPTETWTVKCVSVQRTNLNAPIAGTASFTVFGSVSGTILDANGNPIVWLANNVVVSNSILSFSILETTTPFRQGDYFTVQVKSGALIRNDSLTASYIAVADVNDPTFFSSLNDIAAKHGLVSLDNTLTLGAQLAFANSPPGIMALQAAPPLPRRTSYVLEQTFLSTSTNVEDFEVPLPLGVTPDPNSQIHFFVTNPTTLVETQLLPNKFTFYTLDTLGNPTTSSFVFDNANPPSGNSFSYSVNQSNATINFALDGYVNRSQATHIDATFSSASVVFDSSYIGKTLNVIDAVNLANIGSFSIVGVVNGMLQIRATSSSPFSVFVNDLAQTMHYNLLDPTGSVVISGSAGTDGYLSDTGLSTGLFTSLSHNFALPDAFADGYKLQILTSTTSSNIGIFDITGRPNATSLNIAKSFVSEHNTKFEVIDTTQTSDYLIVNKNIVPNGYKLRITLVDLKDASFFDAGWETALATLETQELDILVPLPQQTISVIFENCLAHCQAMSNIQNKKERVLFIGAIQGLTPDNLTGAKPAAVESIGILEGLHGNTVAEVLSGDTEDLANYSVSNAFGGTYRCVYFAPDQIVVQVGTQNQFVDGFYQAAAAAGFFSATPNLAIPLTYKVLAGYSILKNRQYSQTVLSQLASAGVSTAQPVTGGGKIIWGKTTTQSGFPEEQEISIVFIRDAIAKAMRAGFAAFIGNPEDSDVISTLFARGNALMQSFISQKWITDFANLSITQDTVDPTQYNVTVQVVPTYPLNFIFVAISVGQI